MFFWSRDCLRGLSHSLQSHSCSVVSCSVNVGSMHHEYTPATIQTHLMFPFVIINLLQSNIGDSVLCIDFHCHSQLSLIQCCWLSLTFLHLPSSVIHTSSCSRLNSCVVYCWCLLGFMPVCNSGYGSTFVTWGIPQSLQTSAPYWWRCATPMESDLTALCASAVLH